jgi:hypothetical protein
MDADQRNIVAPLTAGTAGKKSSEKCSAPTPRGTTKGGNAYIDVAGIGTLDGEGDRQGLRDPQDGGAEKAPGVRGTACEVVGGVARGRASNPGLRCDRARHLGSGRGRSIGGGRPTPTETKHPRAAGAGWRQRRWTRPATLTLFYGAVLFYVVGAVAVSWPGQTKSYRSNDGSTGGERGSPSAHDAAGPFYAVVSSTQNKRRNWFWADPEQAQATHWYKFQEAVKQHERCALKKLSSVFEQMNINIRKS